MGGSWHCRYNEISIMASFSDGINDIKSLFSGRLASSIKHIIPSDSESILLKVESHGLTHVSYSEESNSLLRAEESSDWFEHLIL
jgi:hypothetical protein